MIRPQRIRLERRVGFNLRAASLALNGLRARACVRPHQFGNPWEVVPEADGFTVTSAFGHNRCFPTRDEALAAACEAYRAWLRREQHWSSVFTEPPDILPLRGLNLACYCAPRPPGYDGPALCHVDVIMEELYGD